MPSTIMDQAIICSIFYFCYHLCLGCQFKLISLIFKTFLLTADSHRKHVHLMRAALFVEFGRSDPLLLVKDKILKCQALTGSSIFFGLPPTGAGPHAPTDQAPSPLSLCHYAVVNSAIYSVINHHLEGSAGSQQKGEYSCRWCLSDQSKVIMTCCWGFVLRRGILFLLRKCN